MNEYNEQACIFVCIEKGTLFKQVLTFNSSQVPKSKLYYNDHVKMARQVQTSYIFVPHLPPRKRNEK